MVNPHVRCNDVVVELVGDPDLVARLAEVLVDLATTPVADPRVWCVETFGAHARVTCDQDVVVDWARLDVFVACVISALTMTVVAAQSTQLHLHAAAVVSEGTTIVLPAPSGSGKSTLTCALVAAGAWYRTDELVAVDADGRDITTYPKPLSIKTAGVDVVKRLTGLVPDHRSAGWELPARLVGRLAPDGQFPVSTVAFNRYEPGRPAIVESVHRTTAVRLLLADSQDAEAVGPASLAIAANLVRTAQCFRATGGDAVELAQAILDAGRAPSEPAEVVLVEPPTGTSLPARAADVASVVIDGRAVLYTPEPSRLIELDETQTVWWLLLDGTPVHQIVEDVAKVTGVSHGEVAKIRSAVVAALRSLGILADV
jgi:hypothetical protein